jgi:hypothetical protein
VPDRGDPRARPRGVADGAGVRGDRPRHQRRAQGRLRRRLAGLRRRARGVPLDRAWRHDGRGRREPHPRGQGRARVPAQVDGDRPGGEEPPPRDRPQRCSTSTASTGSTRSRPEQPRARVQRGPPAAEDGPAGGAVVRDADPVLRRVPVEVARGASRSTSRGPSRSSATTTSSTRSATWWCSCRSRRRNARTRRTLDGPTGCSASTSSGSATAGRVGVSAGRYQ